MKENTPTVDADVSNKQLFFFVLAAIFAVTFAKFSIHTCFGNLPLQIFKS